MKELSLKQNLLWNTIGSLIYQGCQWLTTILVVVLSPSYENSGILAFAMATGNIYSALATYNVRTFQISDVKNQFSSENYVGFRLATIGLASLVCFTYSFVVSPDISTSIAIVAFLFFKADESFANVLYGIDQKALRMDYIGVSQTIRGFASLLAFAGTLLLMQNLAVACFAMFVCALAVTLAYDIPRANRLGSVRPQLAKKPLLNC